MRHRVEAHQNQIHEEVTVRRGKIATRYNTWHHVEVFGVGDLVSVGIPREDRAKTDNKRLYYRTIAKPRHQLLCKYDIWHGLYPSKAL